WSSLHSKRANDSASWSGCEKVNVAEVRLVRVPAAGSAESIAGASGAGPATSQSQETSALWLPAASVARTRKLWLPASGDGTVKLRPHGSHSPSSSAHSVSTSGASTGGAPSLTVQPKSASPAG